MDIKVIRSNRRSVCLQLPRTGDPVIRAPYRMRDEEIERFLEKHRGWLEQKLAERREPESDLSDGAAISLFGRRYTVAEGRARLADTTLYLPRENRERALVSLLKKLTLTRMGNLTDEIARRYGFQYERVRVSTARGRWGSCNINGCISYTFRTCFLPDALAYYLAAHELSHTRHHDHSKAFWEEVERVCPRSKEARKQLKNYGWAMNIL